MKRGAGIAWLLVLLLSSASVAEEENERPIIQEERAAPPGTSLTVIKREDIERSHLPFVLDLLRRVPGLHVIQSGGPGDTALIFARGAQSSDVLLLMDGARFNGDLLPVDFAHLTTENIEQIEVERGPLSAVDGSSAVGAVIRIISRTAGPLLSGHAEFGSQETQNYGIRSGVGSDANHVSAAYERYDTGVDPQAGAYRNNTFSANARVMITQWTSAGLIYRDIDTRNDIPTGPDAVEPYFAQDRHTRILSFPISQQIVPWFSLEAEFSSLKQELNQANTRMNTYRFQGHFLPLKKHDLVAGYEREDDTTTPINARTEQKLTNNAFFAEYRWKASPDFLLDAAIRTDDDNLNSARVSPRVSAQYQWKEHLRLHGSAGSGYRRRATDELLLTENSKHERSQGVDFGADWIAAKTWTASATVFHTRYQDSLMDPVFEPQSISTYNATGLELQAEIRPGTDWVLRGAYTLTHTDIDTATPENEGSVDVVYSHKKLQAGVEAYLIGNSLLSESHARLDASISMNVWEDLRIYGRITNMFDAQYDEIRYFPAQGRAAYFGLRWN